MLFLLLIPSTIQTLHAFDLHEHLSCNSNSEAHFHADEMDCSICHLQLESNGNIPSVTSAQSYDISLEIEPPIFYKFYENLQNFSFSLRGPPQR
jgi:hypothetical protein